MKSNNYKKTAWSVFVFLMLTLVPSNAQTNVDATFGTTNGTNWLTTSLWVGGKYPGITGAETSNTNIATFTSTGPTSNLNISGTGGHNLGAVYIDNTRSTSLLIGNKDNSTTSLFRFYGATVNAVPNIIIRNNGSGPLTLLAVRGTAAVMGVGLGNTTENIINIDGSGGITISAIISDLTGGPKNLTVSGAGTGVLTLSSPGNTYSGNTKITNRELRLNPTSTPATFASQFVLNGGTLSTSGIAVNTVFTSSSTLKLDASSTITLNGNVHSLKFAASNGVTWASGVTLNITGWTGTAGESGTGGKIFFGTDANGLTAEQLAKISFNGTPGAAMLSTGELVSASNGSLTPPTLTASTGQTVDNPVNITFTDDSSWRTAITAVKIGGTALTPTTDYEITAGIITLKPTGLNPLITNSSNSVKAVSVEATGYAEASVSQTIDTGLGAKIVMKAQPVAPTTNGGLFATQPEVFIKDQYGNSKTTNCTIVATVGSGDWTLGGTSTISKNANIFNFTDLTATSSAAVTGATITFSGTVTATSLVLTPVTCNAFNIPAPPVTLTAASGATVDGAFDVTFNEDASWRGAITGITVGGTTLDPSAYDKTVAGKITFTPSASILLQSTGNKSIVISATGYSISSVLQVIGAGVPTTNSTANIDATLTRNAGSIITCTAKDQYNNLVSGYAFKYDATVTNSDATTTESYTIDGTSHTATVNNISVTATTNASGVATFSTTLPAAIDGNDGVSIQIQLNDGATNVGSAFTYTAPVQTTFTINGGGNTNSSTLNLTAASDITVATGTKLTLNNSANIHTLTVAAGAKLTLNNGINLTGAVTLESTADATATLMDSNESPTIVATVKQYVTAGRNWYMSAPTNNTDDASDLNKGTSVQHYNEVAGAWQNASGTLTRGKGYVQVAGFGAGTTGAVEFTGTTNSGNVAVALTYTESTGKGFNLVGNPYPSYLSWTAVATDPLNTNETTGAKMPNGTMWYRTTNYNSNSAWETNKEYALNAIVYNGTRFYKVTTAGTSAPSGTGPNATVGTTGITDGTVTWTCEGSAYVFATIASNGDVSSPSVSNLIPPMQAFWVKSTGGTLTFTNAMRTHETVGNTLKAPKSNQNALPYIRLHVTNGATADNAVLYANAEATNELDYYDAPKYFNTVGSNQAEIFTLAGAEKLTINAMYELNAGTEVPLGFATENANNFRISVTELKNISSDLQVVLQDKLINTEFDLTNGESYHFSSTTVKDANRFNLIFKSKGTTTGVENTIKTNVQVFVNAANQITIIAPAKSHYAIYNSLGMLLGNGLTTSNYQNSNLKLATGVYFVKVNNQSTRIIVK